MPEPGAATTPPRTASREPAALSRPERSPRPAAPAPALLALTPAPSRRDRGPTTRDRLRASFAARAEPPSLAVAPPIAPAAVESVPAPAEPALEAPALTTRQRIVNGARAGALAPEIETVEPVSAAGAATVIDIEALRERRRQREGRLPSPAVEDRPEGVERAPGTPGPPARGPPGAEASAIAQVRATSAGEAAESEKTLTPSAAGTSRADPAAVARLRTARPASGEAPAGATAEVRAPEPTPSVEPAAADAEAAAPAPEAPAAEITAAGTTAGPEAAEPASAGPEPAEAAAAESQAAEAEAAEAATPEPAVVRNPEDEPGFQAMVQRTQRAADRTKSHQPAAEGAATAQGAALAPDNDVSSQAAGAQVEVMGEQEPGVFDAQAFIAAVRRAVAAATPGTLEDADEFKESGRVGEATAEIQGLVKGGKLSAQQAIQTATEGPPDPAAAVPKTVTDMVNDEAGPPLDGVGAMDAMPGPRPAEETDLSAGPAQVDAEMASANVTDEQVARSNEPDFTAALDARQKARDHAATAPAGYRAEEESILAQGREAAAGDATAELAGMHGARAGALERVLGDKQGTKSAHEAEHARVASEIEAIYEATRSDVETILTALDAKVDDDFTRGEEAARTRFETYVDESMRAYKADRYGGLGGGARWAWDKLTGMPDEVNRFYEQGRDDYLRAMDVVIEGIANTVGAELTAARARIVEGRAEIRAYVESLPKDLQAIGEDAADKLEGKFDELASEVDAKQDALVDAVARRYVESRDALDKRIEELKAANKGLVQAALDAVVGVIKTIIALGEMLLRVLAKAAEVVGDIVSDPIGFLSNMVDAVMGGLNRFVARIAIHLQNALVEWLFGTLGGAGITLPKALDGAGILDLVTQILGLTYANIRARVARVVGEPVVAQMEQAVDLFQTLATAGVGGLWEFVADKLADLEDIVLGKISEYVIERVIKGGIAWIIGLLNPVAAFIKACKAIYEIVMFIVDRAKQVMEFVDAILDSISAIAKGDLGAAEEKVESSLARALPLAIGFLASLLGIGDLSEKIKSIIAVVRRPVEKAIDTVVMGIARTFKRAFGGAAAWTKGKVEAGRAWAREKVEAGKDWVGEKAAAGAKLLQGRAGSAAVARDVEREQAANADAHEPKPAREAEEEHDVALGTALAAIPETERQYLVNDEISYEDAAKVAASVKAEHPVLTRLEVVEGDESWDYRWAGSGSGTRTGARRRARDPGTSAPGLGRVGLHGSKPPSLRRGPEIHWLESEHIIPFATGKRLWQMVELVVPGRGGHEDRGQTTIMIYYEAARFKTPADNQLSEGFEAAVAEANVQERLATARRKADTGDRAALGIAADIVAQLMQGLRVARDNAVTRTVDAIAAENALRMSGSTRTNGERRGPRGRPEAPLPGASEVQTAADSQYDDVVELVEQEMAAANALRR